jgi:uncharacterized membrane protein YkvA (DUF1232 family)
MRKKFMQSFDKAKVKAEKIAHDKEAATKLIEEALKKSDSNRGKLHQVKDDLSAIIRMLSLWVKGQYDDVPWKTIISSFAAIIYLVNPMDIVPDFIAGVGFLDDITILSFVFNLIRLDLDRFRDWENKEK